jgi:hypothetical protein
MIVGKTMSQLWYKMRVELGLQVPSAAHHYHYFPSENKWNPVLQAL